MTNLIILILSLFVGLEVITKIPPTLHTPLMSATNAISGITIIGAIVAVNAESTLLATILGMLALVFATVNVVGGYLVTHRMLSMFNKKAKK